MRVSLQTETGTPDPRQIRRPGFLVKGEGRPSPRAAYYARAHAAWLRLHCGNVAGNKYQPPTRRKLSRLRFYKS